MTGFLKSCDNFDGRFEHDGMIAKMAEDVCHFLDKCVRISNYLLSCLMKNKASAIAITSNITVDGIAVASGFDLELQQCN